MIIEILQVLYFMLPAYCANMAPVLLRRHFHGLSIPIDGNRKFLGKPILGKNKTWRGFIVAILVGLLIYQIQVVLAIPSIVTYSETTFLLGILLGSGAIIGDAVKSLIKRRVGIRSGKPFPLFDQLDFVVGALLLSSLVVSFSVQNVLIAIVVSPILTIVVNHFAYYTKIRGEKW